MTEFSSFRGGFDECKMRIASMHSVITDFRNDIQTLQKAKDKTKQEIRDFECLMSEFKASGDNQLHKIKKQLELDLVQLRHSQEEIKQLSIQFKTQIRNQTHHHTELAKQLAIDQIQIVKLVEET